MTNPRIIPSIEQLRQRDPAAALERIYGRQAVVEALRDEASVLRERLSRDAESGPQTEDEAARVIEAAAEARLHRGFRPSLRAVINATGVILHTNLGRAPLAESAAGRIAELASAYGNLEYDLDQGRRGHRDRHAAHLLCALTGAEAAVVVNNNAAATLIALAALANGREVVISRGELVEIGGGFRVPDVMAQSGAILREVGTTNKTRLGDYSAAISERTAMILRVHPSNFRIDGFVERPTLGEIVTLGRQLGVPVAEDLGSGLLFDDALGGEAAMESEPSVQASIATGADLVWFSGDKLLGGPQAGVIVGREALVTQVRRHPLMRALRVDKMTYAGLEATLIEYQRGQARKTIPVARMITEEPAHIEARARAVAEAIAGPAIGTAILDGASTIGGGSVPGSELPTRLLGITVAGTSARTLEARLRALDPPVIARIEDDLVVLDLRTVLPDQDQTLIDVLRRVAE